MLRYAQRLSLRNTTSSDSCLCSIKSHGDQMQTASWSEFMLFSWHCSLWDFLFLGVLGCSWNPVAATLTSCQREPANPRILISKPVFGAGKLQTDIDPNWASHRNSWLLHLDIHLRHVACRVYVSLYAGFALGHEDYILFQNNHRINCGTILSGTIKRNKVVLCALCSRPSRLRKVIPVFDPLRKTQHTCHGKRMKEQGVV